MQQELLMFKEVEMMMKPSLRETKNREGQNFLRVVHHRTYKITEWRKVDEEHIYLINNDKPGIHIRLIETVFHVFAISDANALYFSSISIIMFLTILTSGYIDGFSEIFASQVDGWSIGSLHTGEWFDASGE
ncbi:hypothetical protein Dsin_022093 [Dipteronia sinensis]|uniref:Uncharacterized protein n=1 Tax=Dipteronia sinensis TaxID=43782 RepID=A0AAE0A142_9ROSI|nr:hypothetical protein Dsin_022093 [Dipteronia sinensis]